MLKFWIQYADDKVTVEQEGNALRVCRYSQGELLYTAAVYHHTQQARAIEFACVLSAGIRGAF